MKLKKVRNQVVFFGASSRIGRAAARKFAERGAKIVISARDQSELDALARELRKAGAECTAIAAEASDFDQVKAVADRAVEKFGRIDTWVHLAGVYMTAPFEHTTRKSSAE